MSEDGRAEQVGDGLTTAQPREPLPLLVDSTSSDSQASRLRSRPAQAFM
jgi:hypothetical protein